MNPPARRNRPLFRVMFHPYGRHIPLFTSCTRSSIVLLAVAVLGQTADPPLPDTAALKQRVIENERRSAELKERYLCEVRAETAELRSDGSIKRTDTKTSEQFYVNGREIEHVLAKNGHQLTGEQERDEQERVAKQIKKYSDARQVQKELDRDQRRLNSFLRALQYKNGRRESIDGRPTISYDLEGDPGFHPANLEERFAKSVVGRIHIDEQTGELRELRIRTANDLKIGGGLLANLHKGSQFHIVQTRQSDGVWFPTLIEGSGDARAMLFVHPRFRFKRTTGPCRLYNVDAQSSVETTPPK